jgi:hypothetical protein
MTRVLRPTLSGSPSASSTSVTMLASQQKRRADSAAMDGPCSMWQHPAARLRRTRISS